MRVNESVPNLASVDRESGGRGGAVETTAVAAAEGVQAEDLRDGDENVDDDQAEQTDLGENLLQVTDLHPDRRGRQHDRRTCGDR